MSRRYGDSIDVRPLPAVAGALAAPAAFLWRERLYVVRSVLGHWQERRAWWSAGTAGSAGIEHEVWRVEASRGQAYPCGVYDLRRDPAVDEWQLFRVAD